MLNQKYALATTDEGQLNGRLSVSTPAAHVETGDIVVSGAGTLTWTYREVTDTRTDYRYDPIIILTFADGTTASFLMEGWCQAIKMDPAKAERAANFATAYATAWDNRK